MPMTPTTPLVLGMMPVTLLGPLVGQLGPLYTLHDDIAESQLDCSAHVTVHAS